MLRIAEYGTDHDNGQLDQGGGEGGETRELAVELEGVLYHKGLMQFLRHFVTGR